MFLQGFLGERGDWVWFFDGVTVVKCVVNVWCFGSGVFGFEKCATVLGFIFLAAPFGRL